MITKISNNALYINHDRLKLFTSYKSIIFELVENDGNLCIDKIYPDWDYSQTTSKHINKFLDTHRVYIQSDGEFVCLTDQDRNGRKELLTQFYEVQ